MCSLGDRLNACLLQRAQLTPPKRVDDMVLNEWIELVESAQRSRENASMDLAAIEFRSSVLSSSSPIVSR